MNLIKHPWRYLALALITALLLIIAPLKFPVGWALPTIPLSWSPDSDRAPQKETLAPSSPLSQSLSQAFSAGHWEREMAMRPTSELGGLIEHRDLVADLATVDDYLDQGQAFYDLGRFAEAIAPWQQALTLAEQQNDGDGMAIAHNYLAIGYQALSQWDDAQQSVAQGLSVLTSSNTGVWQI